ncbi:unnamed protein product [Discosporangium mesarthrocarpum]
MEAFEKGLEEEEARRAAIASGGPDENGFETVTYKKKRGRERLGPGGGGAGGGWTAAGGGGEGQGRGLRRKKRKGSEGLPDFYRFQMREARRDQLVRLRKRFEEDKARVERMKAQRKFKPF